MPPDLDRIARRIREHPGLAAKRSLAAVAGTVGGDGDDAALIPFAGTDASLVVGAEAILPSFLAREPRAAGVAGVVAAINDLAAQGARPLAVLDTITAPDAALAKTILAGLHDGSELYETPLVGGHLTIEPTLAAGLSTVAVGRAVRPLAAANARPGDAVSLAVCTEGEVLPGEGGELFFSHLRGPRRSRAAADIALLADAAEAGEAWAARDVSMPGIAGSLLQLLESAGGLGCALDLTAIAAPAELALEDWLGVFPSFAFLLVGDPVAIADRFETAGLTADRLATLDHSGRMRVTDGEREVEVWDLAREPLTGLRP